MLQKRVLLVEDEPGVRLTLAGNLELEGFEVVEAQNAEEALEILRGTPVDLVLSDIRMPGMGGLALLRKVREFHSDLPVVLMTAFTTEENIEEAIGSGVFTILAKPFEITRTSRLLYRAMAQPLVLVVDVNSTGAEQIEQELLRAKLRVTRIDSEVSAVELISDRYADVCIAHVNGAGDTSLRLVEFIHKKYPSVAIVVVTGSASPHLMSRIARLGGRCLGHPPDPDRLLRMLSELRAEGAHA